MNMVGSFFYRSCTSPEVTGKARDMPELIGFYFILKQDIYFLLFFVFYLLEPNKRKLLSLLFSIISLQNQTRKNTHFPFSFPLKTFSLIFLSIHKFKERLRAVNIQKQCSGVALWNSAQSTGRQIKFDRLREVRCQCKLFNASQISLS